MKELELEDNSGGRLTLKTDGYILDIRVERFHPILGPAGFAFTLMERDQINEFMEFLDANGFRP